MNDLDRRACEALGMAFTGEPSPYVRFSGGKWRPVPSFSTDMNAAMELDALALKAGYWLLIEKHEGLTIAAYVDLAAGPVTKDHEHEVEATARTLAFLELHDAGKLGEKQ